jgi:aspartate-semialdehyde dehydrogenase
MIAISSISEFNPSEFVAVVCTSEGIMQQKQILDTASQGIKIINATSYLNGIDNIPMIVGGINEGFSCPKNIINVPSPHVVQLLSAVAGLCKYNIKSIRVSAYVAADFEGQDGMTELYNQTRRILMNDMLSSSNKLFHKTLAFNIIPQVGSFIGEETSVEWAYNSQIKQVVGSDVKVHANCAIVPAFVGLGQYVNIETSEEIDADEAREDIKKTKGVLIVDRQEDGGYVSLNDVQGESSVFVSRIRQDMTVTNGISLWVAGDSYKISAQNILALLKQLLKNR